MSIPVVPMSSLLVGKPLGRGRFATVYAAKRKVEAWPATLDEANNGGRKTRRQRRGQHQTSPAGTRNSPQRRFIDGQAMYALKVFTGGRLFSKEQVERERWDLEGGGRQRERRHRARRSGDEAPCREPETESEKASCAATREFRALQAIPPHMCLLSLVSLVDQPGTAAFLFEKAPHGDLYAVLKKQREKRIASVRVVARFLLDVARALEHMHAHGWIHRDVKPENVLIFGPPEPKWWRPKDTHVTFPPETEGVARLADLNWAAPRDAVRPCCVGTVDYLSPEMVRRDAHDFSTDMWSLGVLAFELHEGTSPFYEHEEVDTTNRITFGAARAFHAPPYAHDAPRALNEFRDWVKALLNKNPRQRPTAAASVVLLRRLAFPEAHRRPETPPVSPITPMSVSSTGL